MKLHWIAVPMLVAQGATVHAQEIDPFYERLFVGGRDAYHRGDYASAIKELRIANFGLLHAPKRLAYGLSLLALAQYRHQDLEGVRASFLRIAELENRFRAYSDGGIPAALREELERALLLAIPDVTLESSVAFEPLVTRKWEGHFASLSTEESRDELAKRMAEEPVEPRWPLMLAKIELTDKRFNEAAHLASQALTSRPGLPEALLIRGMAYRNTRMWDEAAADLEASGRAGESAQTAEALIYAYVYSGRSQDAIRFVAELPSSVRKDSRIDYLAKQIPPPQTSRK